MTGWNELGDSDDWLVVSSQSTVGETYIGSFALKQKRENKAKKIKNKKTAHVQSFEPCIKFSMEQQINCLSDVRIPSGDHQAIPLLFSKSIYTPLMKEAPVPFIWHVSHKQWESEKGWTLGHLRVSLLYICDKVRSCGWDIVLWKSLITFERLMMKLWAKERKITICGKKPDLFFFVHVWLWVRLCNKIFNPNMLKM